MGKFKMPTVQQFLDKKIIYDKNDPVWIFLEKEMRENDAKGIKPYNETVGEWLRFLRELRYYFYREGQRKEKRLQREAGPPWYYELSTSQRDVLKKLKVNIHQDLLEDIPTRTRQALADLGVTLKVPKSILMKAMTESIEDPGVFIWFLYKAVYKQSPNEQRGTYDMNAMILMSSLVFIDLDECIESLKELVGEETPSAPPRQKKHRKYYEPKCRYSEYLQKMYVPLFSNHGTGKEKKVTPKPLGYKLKMRSVDSYEKLCKDMTFLDKRIERNKKAAMPDRICKYKFWEPPSTLRNMNPKMIAYVEKLKMIKLKAKPKFHAQFDNVQYQIGGVAFVKDKPQYLLTNVATLPTGYMPINGGIAYISGAFVTTIVGYWQYPRSSTEKCDHTCDCLAKWEEIVMKHIKETKCKCGHLYDYYHEGVSKEKYFYPPSRHGPFWIDQAKVFQMDPMEDFIKDTVRNAVESETLSQASSAPSLSASAVSIKDLLAAFLADLSDTPLLIPHLPQACLLNNLQEWVRKRVKGKLDPKEHKKFILKSQRSWLDLKHIDFRARAYRIPFTLKQLHNMNWSHRYMIQELFHILLDDFVSRNRLKQFQQTRLWWSTTKFDAYPSKAFLDIFFTYMPGRMKDTFLINPYSSQNTPKYGAKTCPLLF